MRAVLLDVFGLMGLPDHFWEPLRAANGQVRWFNPATLMRFLFRNHRKLNQRSLRINYELMIRIDNREIAAKARGIFAEI